MDDLTRDELVELVRSVFPRLSGDRHLGILVDIPRTVSEDNADWKKRRILAEAWHRTLTETLEPLGLKDVSLIAYPDVGSNNADLPEKVWIIEDRLPRTSESRENRIENLSGQAVQKNTAFPGTHRIFDYRSPQKRRQDVRLPGGHHARVFTQNASRPAHRLWRSQPPCISPEGHARPGQMGRGRLRC